ncbi:MAG: hypothetical protein WAL71_13605 [Terriglobales bacterium]|jgi:membrane protein DedA with SNARE-associated domain
MERADLLYSGLMFTAIILSIWTAALLTAACCYFATAVFGPKFLEQRASIDWLRSLRTRSLRI